MKEMTSEELEQAISERIKQFHGFLSRDVALRLIAKEKGLLKNNESVSKLSEIKKGQKNVSVKARVNKVWQIASYSSGSRSRVIEICDESGSIPLVLWNEDVSIGSAVRQNDVLLVKNAYERNNELHLGYSGSVSVAEKAGFADFALLEEGKPLHIRGFVTRISGFSGGYFSFYVSDNNSECACVISEATERGKQLAVGDEVILESVVFTDKRIEIRKGSRLLSRRPANLLLGAIESIVLRDDSVLVSIGGKEELFDRENALKFFGIAVADDIKLETVATLKKDELLNKSVAIKASRQAGKTIIG